ncbi:PRK06851 family protein [Clostridium sp.]|uniref:PRK06851 family protein n=1 Tax=Clostridium sp. TaxID=1506 RepID=UPI00346494A5
MNKNIKHTFAGGNTSVGFYSFYKYIINPEIAKRIICLKGGPGTGKSTLMKAIGNHFLEKGYEIEFHHCSSDNTSIDGVVIKELNVALVDGTAPHIVDPIYPGAIDEILNLGDCWIEEGFSKYRTDIINTSKLIGQKFKRAYRFLGAARNIHEDWVNYNLAYKNNDKLNLIKENLRSDIFNDIKLQGNGKERHLFLTAFTPNGIVSFKEDHSRLYEKMYLLKGGPGTGKTEVLKFLGEEALRHGLYVEFYHDPFIPERIENIAIPSLSLAIFSSNEINSIPIENDTEINMDSLLSPYVKKDKEEIDFDRSQFYFLINKALSSIKEAKSLHDDLEKFYVDNIDFDKVKVITDNLIKRIEDYA